MENKQTNFTGRTKGAIIGTIVSVILLIPTLGICGKITDYGFEDWTGDRATVPGYPFSSNYAQYCDAHDNAVEVVTGYNGWTPHSGSYFLIQNDSSDYVLSPSISGITQGTVQAYNQIGVDGNSCKNDDLIIEKDITTGEIFIRVWARFNKGFYSIADGGRLKFFRVYAIGTSNSSFIHLSTSDGVSPNMYIYNVDEGGWIDSATATNAYDGNWHKFSFYINYNTGVIRGWYDIDIETAENATVEYIANDGSLGTATGPSYMEIQGNFSAKYPTEITYHAIDDLEIWDGLPGTDTTQPPVASISPPSNFRILTN